MRHKKIKLQELCIADKLTTKDKEQYLKIFREQEQFIQDKRNQLRGLIRGAEELQAAIPQIERDLEAAKQQHGSRKEQCEELRKKVLKKQKTVKIKYRIATFVCIAVMGALVTGAVFKWSSWNEDLQEETQCQIADCKENWAEQKTQWVEQKTQWTEQKTEIEQYIQQVTAQYEEIEKQSLEDKYTQAEKYRQEYEAAK